MRVRAQSFSLHYCETKPTPPIPPPPPKPTQLLSPSLNTKPQIGWDSLLEGGNHKPHSAGDVISWRAARNTRQQAHRVTA